MIWDAMTGQLIDSLKTTGVRVGRGVQPRRPDDRLDLHRDGERGQGRHDLGRDDPPVDPDHPPPERLQALDLQPRRHPSRRDRR